MYQLVEYFHYEKMQARFFVENASITFELKKVSGKIWDEEKESVHISIFVSPSAIPHSVQKELTSETVKLPNVTKSKGYEVPQQALDLRRVHSDPNVMTYNIEMGPNLRNCMAASLQIQEENRPKLLSFNSSNNTPYKLVGLPDTMQKAHNLKSLNLSKNEVRSDRELDKVKGLEPEEMFVDRNPLCTTFPDKSTNISSILELFPKLLRLDNHEVPPPIVFGTEASKKLPVCKGSIFGSETLGNLILLFLHQYDCIYDYGDQHGLLDAYHNEACFSLAIPFNPEDPPRNSLDKYSKGSRNMRKLKEPSEFLCVHLLKHTKHDIVDFLSELPRTQHDISSLMVDMCVQTEKLLCFSVSGAFKEASLLSETCPDARTLPCTNVAPLFPKPPSSTGANLWTPGPRPAPSHGPAAPSTTHPQQNRGEPSDLRILPRATSRSRPVECHTPEKHWHRPSDPWPPPQDASRPHCAKYYAPEQNWQRPSEPQDPAQYRPLAASFQALCLHAGLVWTPTAVRATPWPHPTKRDAIEWDWCGPCCPAPSPFPPYRP
ncbi:nuclear RNA export factor 1-like [Elephas maximus indicus]|uniref:nuclear RNA export factor 1-like n=1 Tax=Elephas maximus indicus TaxID=99487 RepID=UPI002115FD0F|nr:nuclear RNA export factor 1-like [Elephas maximus indicus]XP_049727397.1 nuclear RNA export factor 1-like [Elephas maximus indicus]